MKQLGMMNGDRDDFQRGGKGGKGGGGGGHTGGGSGGGGKKKGGPAPTFHRQIPKFLQQFQHLMPKDFRSGPKAGDGDDDDDGGYAHHAHSRELPAGRNGLVNVCGVRCAVCLSVLEVGGGAIGRGCVAWGRGMEHRRQAVWQETGFGWREWSREQRGQAAGREGDRECVWALNRGRRRQGGAFGRTEPHRFRCPFPCMRVRAPSTRYLRPTSPHLTPLTHFLPSSPSRLRPHSSTSRLPGKARQGGRCCEGRRADGLPHGQGRRRGGRTIDVVCRHWPVEISERCGRKRGRSGWCRWCGWWCGWCQWIDGRRRGQGGRGATATDAGHGGVVGVYCRGGRQTEQ